MPIHRATVAQHVERSVTGVTLEFYGSGMQRMDTAFVPTVAKLQSICHVGIGTPRYREAIEFYERVLNFRTSDEIDGRINLMRCFPNPLHHSLAIAHAGRNSLHHVNFMVSDDGDLQRARARFRAHRVFPARPESFDSSGSTRDARMAGAGDIEPGL